jgi:hypothetical protein
MTAHVVALAIGEGAVTADTLGEQGDKWVALYQQNIVDPVENMLQSSVLHVAGQALFWGAVGVGVLFGLAMLFKALRDARRASHDVNYTVEHGTIHHPALSSALLFWLWRVAVAAGIASGTIALFPFFRFLLERDAGLLASGSLWELALRATITLVCWMAVVHAYIVGLRLFMRRTRIFGEMLY